MQWGGKGSSWSRRSRRRRRSTSRSRSRSRGRDEQGQEDQQVAAAAAAQPCSQHLQHQHQNHQQHQQHQQSPDGRTVSPSLGSGPSPSGFCWPHPPQPPWPGTCATKDKMQPCLIHLHVISLVARPRPRWPTSATAPKGRSALSDRPTCRLGTEEMIQPCLIYLHVISLGAQGVRLL